MLTSKLPYTCAVPARNDLKFSNSFSAALPFPSGVLSIIFTPTRRSLSNALSTLPRVRCASWSTCASITSKRISRHRGRREIASHTRLVNSSGGQIN